MASSDHPLAMIRKTPEIDLLLRSSFGFALRLATAAGALDVSTTVDRLNDVVPVLLPFSDTTAVRDLLPQLARLKRTADREDEVYREK